MNKKTKIITLIAVVAAIFGVLLLFQNKRHELDANTISIAGNLPLTGPVAAWSGEFANGFKMGIEDACAEYGVDPATFNIDMQDNAGKPAQAASVVQKQLAQGFDVYLSGSSESSKAVVDQVDSLGVPHFIVAFDPFMAAQNSSRLRIMANSKIEAPLFIDYAGMREASSVFVIHLDSAYANEEFGNIVIPALQKKGVSVQSEAYEFSTKDFKTIVLKAAQAKPDLIYICGYSFHLRPLISDLRANGLIKDGNVMGVMDVVDFLYDGTPKEELQGLVFASPLFDIPGAITSAQKWRDRFEARFGKNPSYVPAYAYDNAYAIVKAYSESGKTDVSAIRSALPFEGVTGKVTLDEDGDIVATVAIARLNAEGIVERVNP